MSFQESFEKLKKKAESFNASNVNEHLAYQFNIVGEDEGIFYIEFTDGKVVCEPFDYIDNTAVISATSEELTKYFNGEIAVISVEGDAEAMWNIIKASETVKPAAKKTTTKKPAAKKTSATKTATKKTSTTKTTTTKTQAKNKTK